jgi:hypothetical protein
MSNLKITRHDKPFEYPQEFIKWGMPFKKVHEDSIGCVYQQIVGTLKGQPVFRYECFLHNHTGFYPSSSQWGVRAWTCNSLERALEKLEFESQSKVK